MKITTVGIDLAKNVFHIHGITESGKMVISKACSELSWTKYFFL